MLPEVGSSRREIDDRAIERSTCPLDHADNEVHLVQPSDVGELVHFWAGYFDRALPVEAELLAPCSGAGADDSAEPEAAWIGRDERFREKSKLGAVSAGIGCQLRQFFKRTRLVE
jgi:hypothetical protein